MQFCETISHQINAIPNCLLNIYFKSMHPQDSAILGTTTIIGYLFIEENLTGDLYFTKLEGTISGNLKTH